MEEPKTLSYDWQYGREELFLREDRQYIDMIMIRRLKKMEK